MCKKRFGPRNEEAECMKVTMEQNVCVCRFLLIFPGRPMWLSKNTSIVSVWQRQRSHHLSTPFLPNKGEHLSSLYLSPSLQEQYVVGRERWQERERENEREGKHTPLTRFTLTPPLSQASPPPICLSAWLPLPLISAAKQREDDLSRLVRPAPPFMMQGRLIVTSRQLLIWDVNVKMWVTQWDPFQGLQMLSK